MDNGAADNRQGRLRLEWAISVLESIAAQEAGRIRLRSEPDQAEALGVANLAEVAGLLTRASQLRAESRGPHYRTDYPAEGNGAQERGLVWRLERGKPTARWDRLGINE